MCHNRELLCYFLTTGLLPTAEPEARNKRQPGQRVSKAELIIRIFKTNNRLLWEFLSAHTDLHATYVLTGTQIVKTKAAVQDDLTQSDVMSEDVAQENYCLTLVAQEHLDEMTNQFAHLYSIHVYSVGPSNSDVSGAWPSSAMDD
jgi:hypothetical protein